MSNIFDDIPIPPPPELSEEVHALLGLAGVKVIWHGSGWYCKTDYKTWHVSRKTVTLDQWRAVLDSVVRAEPPQPSS